MKIRANLFDDLYKDIISFNNEKKFYDYSKIEIFIDCLQHYLIKLKKEFYDLDKKTFLCFNEEDTYFLRLRYGLYSNGELLNPIKMSEKLQISNSEIKNRLEMLLVVLKRRVFDNIVYMIDGLSPKKLIAELNFNIKTKRILLNSGLVYLDDLLNYNLDEVSNIKGIGDKAKNEIIDVVHKNGFMFKDEELDRMINTESLRFVLIQRVKQKKEEVNFIQNEIDSLENKKSQKLNEIENLLKRIEELEEKIGNFKK